MPPQTSPATAALWHRLQQSGAFWDVDPATLDPDRHATWIIERILQFGDWDAWQALFGFYPEDQIRAAVSDRRVPPHIRLFWQTYFEKASEAAMALHPETLQPSTASVWQQWGGTLCPSGYLLGGGTALALYLGHRQSDDLDFFTRTPGDPDCLLRGLEDATVPVSVVDRSRHSLHVQIQGVSVSYLFQPGVSLEPGAVWQGIPLVSLPTLVALKCNAIANRGARKDFVDLYALLRDGWTLAQVLDAATQHAPQIHRAHLLRSLTYFVEADQEPSPVLFREWTWVDIQQTLTREVHTYLRKTLPRGPHL